MKLNVMMSLNLKPVQRRQIIGMVATLAIVAIKGYGPNITPQVWRVSNKLTKALLPDATFDTIVEVKYLLNDLLGVARLYCNKDIADCLGLVGDMLQSVFDHYSNLDDCRSIL